MPLLQGFLLGAGFCASIGPQSLFVLRQGIRREAALTVALICTLADFAVIAGGLAGAETIAAAVPDVERIAAWAAAAFVLGYAGFSLLGSLKPKRPEGDRTARAVRTVLAAALAAAAVSLLIPQVYLEAGVAVGLVGLQFTVADRWLFGISVALVSPLWFFGLVLGGRWLSPRLARPDVARCINMATGVAMAGLGLVIIGSEIGAL